LGGRAPRAGQEKGVEGSERWEAEGQVCSADRQGCEAEAIPGKLGIGTSRTFCQGYMDNSQVLEIHDRTGCQPDGAINHSPPTPIKPREMIDARGLGPRGEPYIVNHLVFYVSLIRRLSDRAPGPERARMFYVTRRMIGLAREHVL